jgi:2-keto-4-pentenoate hydratase/2-oxohepta-3-ene-1,7-dioic acid hydratase in catechol pathway
MLLVSFTYQGRDGVGRVRGEELVELPVGSLRQLLEAGDLTAVATAGGPSLPLSAITYRPVVPDPGKILCAGVNYRAHLAESGRAATERPTVFSRYADSQVGHDQPLVAPAVSDRFDYEGELAAVIGTAGAAIAVEDALGHVAGYACYNDGSVRDWQRHSHQWLPGKNWPGTGGFGPWLVTADEVGDPNDLTLTTRVNGEVRQRASTADLIFSIAELISYASSFTPLRPGDVIVTGTPGGAGAFREPPAFLVPGDVVEVEIERVGLLRNTVAAGTATAAASHWAARD